MVDVDTASTAAVLPLPYGPTGIELALDGARWMVSCGSWFVTFTPGFELGSHGALVAVDIAQVAVTGEVELDVCPADLAVDGARYAIASPFGPGLVTGTYRSSLSVDRTSLSLVQGGVLGFCLELGPSFAGDLYLVLGSASGTSPVLFVDGLHVPLAIDAYFFQILLGAGQPPFVGTFGILDAAGRANASLVVGAGSQPQLAGLTLVHAAVAAEPVYGTAQVSTEPVSLALAP